MRLSKIAISRLVTLVTLALLAGAAPVGAANAPKTETSVITWAAGATPNSLAATATTPKDGSTYVDGWSGDAGLTISWTTARNDAGDYVSRAAITFPGPGTYNVTYAITMRAPGGTSWLASQTTSVTVGPDGAVPPGGGAGGTPI